MLTCTPGAFRSSGEHRAYARAEVVDVQSARRRANPSRLPRGLVWNRAVPRGDGSMLNLPVLAARAGVTFGEKAVAIQAEVTPGEALGR